MAITQYASPEYRYSDYDTEIMEDYDNRIGTYNKALTEFQALAEPYQGLVDTYNTQIGTYNTDLGAYKADADAYNAAIAEYNAGPRTEEYAGVASPGQFTGVVPIFEGGAAPVAPEDPGFSGEDVDAFMKTANERAQQSGAANATALAVMNDPTQTYRTAAGDVNLAGMSGFGSTAMGFAYGGPVTSAPIDPMTLGPMGQMMGNPEIVLMPEEPAQVLPQSSVSTMQRLAPPIPQADSYNPVMNQGVGGQFQQIQGLGNIRQQPLTQQGVGGQFQQMFADGGAVSNGIAVYMQDGGEAEGYAAEGKKFADDFGPISNVTAKDAVKFVAEMTPILGDAMAAKELWAEATSENPNWGYITALGGATAIGLIPGAGPLLAKGIKTGAKNVFNVGKNISEKMPKYDPNVLGSMGGNLFGEGTPDFAAELLTENLQKKIPRQKIDNIILKGKTNNKTTEEINKDVLEEARQLKLPFPKRAFDNPKVEYVDTQTISDNIAQYNFPRYDVGKFGGDFESGNLNENPFILKDFEESGKETLKENIFNEGIRDPIHVEVVLSDGSINISEGHHRLQAAIELGIEEVPIIVKTMNKPRASPGMGTDMVGPAKIDVSGLKEYSDYSFSDLDFENRVISPKETPEAIKNRGGSYFFDPSDAEVPLSDRKLSKFYTPMREGYYRKTDGFADGGIVSLRPPVRGPNPQATFEEGGEVQDPKANMRLALEKLSDPQILEMYGIKREELAGNLAMLEAQEYQQNPYESIPQMPL